MKNFSIKFTTRIVSGNKTAMACGSYAVIFCLSIFFGSDVFAQNLSNIGKAKPLTITGGVATNHVAYFSNSDVSRRDPYNYFISGNLNLDIYGWSVPFGFSYANQTKGSFQQPFNQYSLSPVYKWVTGHLGYTSMSFSNYTLNGHTFLGVGADLSPEGPFKFNVMYGRLQKEVVVDETLNQNTEAAYKRMGYGIKTAYIKNKDKVELIIFKAKDDINSNPTIIANGKITPQDNLVVGIAGSKQLFKKLLLNAELAASALTRNQNAAFDSLNHKAIPSLGGLFISNSSTSLYTAYKLGLAYAEKKYTIGIGYERIAPEYKTLGAYYFANDFENITTNLTTKLLKDKLSLVLNTGLQRDDLRHAKQSSTKRFVGSLNASLAASKKMNLNVSYSNFQTYVNIRSNFNQVNALTPYDNLDTLNYTQITQNTNFSGTYMLSQSKEKNQTISANISYMTSADKQGGNTQNTGGRFYNFNGSYNLNIVPKNLSFNVSLNASKNDAGDISTTTIGPTMGVNKSFFDKKLRSSFSTSFNKSYTNGQAGSSIINFRLTNGYVVKKKHNLNLSMVALSRSAQVNSAQAGKGFFEFTSTLGYNYNF
ncbi:hypothetical protein [Nubsella zeaxanthinifaciens]|uniref:hypothetical protein n=1 Tax=Nubsella zeaxanthinifaciens TaxID=392412 RepID=UPI000DE32130|nr:hypothetical protein [Nubsella zeaxanthinifaciens]